MIGKSLLRRLESENEEEGYFKKLVSGMLIVCGSFLLLEHLFQYQGFDLLDFKGHEYYGLAMIIAAFLLSMKWHQWKELKLWNPKNWIR
jgi:hypothetical protein